MVTSSITASFSSVTSITRGFVFRTTFGVSSETGFDVLGISEIGQTTDSAGSAATALFFRWLSKTAFFSHDYSLPPAKSVFLNLICFILVIVFICFFHRVANQDRAKKSKAKKQVKHKHF
jgi:hypothetical protein